LSKLTIEQLPLAGKRVFVRADLNAPLGGGTVADDTRLRAVIPTLRLALDRGAAVVLASHLGRPKGGPDPKLSLEPVAERLGELLARPVPLAPDCVGEATRAQAQAVKAGELLLLENLRFHPEEEKNDDAFARQLAELLMQQELSALGRILEAPERPLVAVLGGAKVSDKVTLVEHLVGKVDALVIGGGMAFTFLRALGHAVGRSLVEPDRIETARSALEQARRRGVQLALPVDAVVADGLDSPSGRAVGIRQIPDDQMGLDIGPRTIEQFTAVLAKAKTIVWNGPMGVFEKPPFAVGTVAIARAVAGAAAFSVIGGGDTIAAVNAAGVSDKIGYISTAGGAFLEFLEGRTLPGVAALTEAA